MAGKRRAAQVVYSTQYLKYLKITTKKRDLSVCKKTEISKVVKLALLLVFQPAYMMMPITEMHLLLQTTSVKLGENTKVCKPGGD